MAHRQRALAGLIIAALAGALLAAPVSAAKPIKEAPSFAVTLNVPSVGSLLGPKVYLAFTFTSTSTSTKKKATNGFARFVTPSVTVPDINRIFGMGTRTAKHGSARPGLLPDRGDHLRVRDLVCIHAQQ